MKKHIDFLWSGHEWCIEDEMAWFIDAERDMLCCLNMLSGKCDNIAVLPNAGSSKFMLNTKCVKIGSEIFCMPCYGDRIWIYNTEDAAFQSVFIENQTGAMLYMEFCWKCGDKLISVSRGLKQVIEIDINTKEIWYYSMDVSKDDVLLSCCVMVAGKIYCTSFNSNRIYQFDMKSKKTSVCTIPNVNEKFSLICFDGKRFWMNGQSKKIYVWDKDKDTAEVVSEFPKQFGNYNFFDDTENIIDCESENYNMQLFCRLQPIGKYIWAIPYRTNLILYIDKDTFEVQVLSVQGEEETKESLNSRRNFKYFWQYLKDDRYIGIFSLKNNYVLEIDTVELKAEAKNYILSDEYIKIIWNGRILNESYNEHRVLFDRLIMMDKGKKIYMPQNEIGNRIFNYLN